MTDKRASDQNGEIIQSSLPDEHPDAVAVALELSAAHLALVEPDPAGLAVHRVPLAAFRPLHSFVEYSVPEPVVQDTPAPATPFPLPGFVVAMPRLAVAEPDPVPTVGAFAAKVTVVDLQSIVFLHLSGGRRLRGEER